MDRNIIEPYKAEERELSDKLYKKLEGLMLLYPPTEECLQYFSNTMFLKANQPAFFQVMSYLFRLHDPVEFKKRFYWPIPDKRAEADFRSAVVDYLKHLSNKHLLNWNIKQYLVVMPGGMKFIVFLLEVVGFIIQEQVRLREKQMGAEISREEICQANLKRMQRQNEILKKFTSDYINQIDVQILNLNNKTQKLRAELFKMELVTSGCSINKEFLQEFELSNKELFEKKFVTYAQNVESLEKALNGLKESIEKFQNKATELRKDKSHIKNALHNIMSNTDSSVLGESVGAWLDTPDAPTINSLFTAFVSIQHTMEGWLSSVVENNISVSDSATSELNDLKTELEQIAMQIVDFQKKYNSSKIKNKDTTVPSLCSNSPMLLKYVFTPLIKSNVVENIATRVSLQDETTILGQCGSFKELTYMRTAQKVRRERTCDQSFQLNNTLTQSTIIDPVQLLRIIYKDSVEKSVKSQKVQSQQPQTSSLLGLKSKERQQIMFDTEKEPETALTVNKALEPLKRIDNISIKAQEKASSKSPYSTCAGENTRNAIIMSCEKSPSTLLLKKPSVVKKVQDDSLNILNLSTSPSGRLEPLVHVEEFASLSLKDTEKLCSEVHTIDDENNANLLNTPIRTSFDIHGLSEDSIFNTSDTLLNEVL